ncbi:putative phage tail protein [Klebsiella pneumoniae]|nr:putative phage tail protein [Klebsiella pneumoniae]
MPRRPFGQPKQTWIPCYWFVGFRRKDSISNARARRNVDTSGAWGGFYLEEYVGTEHRIVMYMDGFGRTDAWSFRAGGPISTPKGDVLTTGSDVRLKTRLHTSV